MSLFKEKILMIIGGFFSFGNDLERQYTKNRLTHIDNMRGIAILFVILEHSISTTVEPLNKWLLSFHMLLLFFISVLVSTQLSLYF